MREQQRATTTQRSETQGHVEDNFIHDVSFSTFIFLVTLFWKVDFQSYAHWIFLTDDPTGSTIYGTLLATWIVEKRRECINGNWLMR